MDKKLKICVYAICKNESKFIDRWINSLKEADCIVVLDTGSTDNTVELLEHYSPFVTVKQTTINPWRFDTARNESMKLIPEDTDICVVSDCDQVFRAGWADALREAFNQGFHEVYGDIIDYDDDGKEIKKFLSKNVHPNSKDWYWERAIHEGIYYHGNEPILSTISDKFVIEHHPDRTKSRGNYLLMLEKEYKENPNDPWNVIYYGCELSFHNRMEESHEVFLKGFNEVDFTDQPEIGYQVCLNLAEIEYNNKNYPKAIYYIETGKKYNVFTRRIYMKQADCYYAMDDYEKAVNCINTALTVTYNARSWIETEYYFKGGCYDSLALTYYAMGKYDEAYHYGLIATFQDPSNERFISNLNYYHKAARGYEND